MIVSVTQDSREFNINILKAKRNNEAPFKY